MASILAVPGLANTTPEFRAALWQMCAANSWDVDSLSAVISAESGFNAAAKNPSGSASGLIQMIDVTARKLGVPNGAAGFRTLSAIEQLPYVEKFYKLQFGKRPPSTLRPVDYYLAVWGNGIGQPMSWVCADEAEPRTFNNGTHNRYTLNAGLDVNHDGRIQVSDLAEHVERQKARAQGKRLEVDDRPLASARVVPRPSSSSSLRPLSLDLLCSSLPALQAGKAALVFSRDDWTERVDAALKGLQRELLRTGHYVGEIDGQIGPRTWRAMLDRWPVP